MKMKDKKAQGSVEWLMGHAWSIVVVLTVASVFAYLGIFEGSARPRFEGLRAAGVQPIADQVQLYSDGILVLTVLNTRPYSHNLEWVEVSPIVDKEDVIRTNLNDIIKQGGIESYNIDASNLIPYIGEAGIVVIPESSAASADFYLCMRESHSAGGRDESHTICGEGINIIVLESTTTIYNPCVEPGAECPCDTGEDCPLGCQTCYVVSIGDPGWCDNYMGPCQDFHPSIPHVCKQTVEHPEGECVPNP